MIFFPQLQVFAATIHPKVFLGRDEKPVNMPPNIFKIDFLCSFKVVPVLLHKGVCQYEVIEQPLPSL